MLETKVLFIVPPYPPDIGNVVESPFTYEKLSEKTVPGVELLTSCGISVRYKCGFHQKLAVIDNKIAWYGSVNFLSFGKNDESIMRPENEDVAGAPAETVT